MESRSDFNPENQSKKIIQFYNQILAALNNYIANSNRSQKMQIADGAGDGKLIANIADDIYHSVEMDVNVYGTLSRAESQKVSLPTLNENLVANNANKVLAEIDANLKLSTNLKKFIYDQLKIPEGGDLQLSPNVDDKATKIPNPNANVESNAQPPDYFDQMPEEIKLHMFSFLTHPQDKTSAEMTSKEFKRLMRDPILESHAYEAAIKEYFPEVTEDRLTDLFNQTNSWKSTFGILAAEQRSFLFLFDPSQHLDELFKAGNVSENFLKKMPTILYPTTQDVLKDLGKSYGNMEADKQFYLIELNVSEKRALQLNRTQLLEHIVKVHKIDLTPSNIKITESVTVQFDKETKLLKESKEEVKKKYPIESKSSSGSPKPNM